MSVLSGTGGAVAVRPRRPPFTPSARRGTALGLAVVAVLGTVASVVLEARVSGSGAARDLVWEVSWLSYAVVGAVVAQRRPDLGVGLVLVLCGASVELAGVLTAAAEVLMRQHPGGATVLGWTGSLLYGPYFWLVGLLLPLHLPDGTLPTGRVRHLLHVGTAAASLWLVAVQLQPGPMSTVPLENPVGWTGAGPVIRVVELVAAVTLALTAVLALGRLVLQWRRASAVRRRALAFLALGAITALLFFGVAVTLQGLRVEVPVWLTQVGTVACIASVPVAVGLAMLRAGFLDIELVLRRTLTYAAMTLVVLGVYAATVLLLGRATGRVSGLSASLLITALAAVGLSPLRERAQRQVDRLLYGRRADPYGVLRDLDAAINRARTPAEVLPAVTGTIAASLRLPYVAVSTTAGALAGTGAPGPVATELPLQHHGRDVGVLQLAARSPGERFSALDDRLLAEVAEHVGSAVAAVGLAEEAQRSREQLVHALEDDRRRIRRDLHDHLGPVLSGITLQLDALRRLTASDAESHALASTVRDEVADAVVEVRRLVHGLRPPVLDELGLVDAVRQHADLLATRMPVDVNADSVPALPAAVEVAAYRIVTEALTNVLRHAQATRAEVGLSAANDVLLVEVRDDGVGIDQDAEPGVGLRSMRERVAQLGGRLEVGAGGPGTVVRAELPT